MLDYQRAWICPKMGALCLSCLNMFEPFCSQGNGKCSALVRIWIIFTHSNLKTLALNTHTSTCINSMSRFFTSPGDYMHDHDNLPSMKSCDPLHVIHFPVAFFWCVCFVLLLRLVTIKNAPSFFFQPPPVKNWLVVWNMLFFHRLGIIISTD